MFFDIGIKDFIDVLLVAFLLYYTYKLMKASGSIKVFTGILVFILIWLVVTQVLEMKLLGSIFDTLMSVGVIALIVLFTDNHRPVMQGTILEEDIFNQPLVDCCINHLPCTDYLI